MVAFYSQILLKLSVFLDFKWVVEFTLINCPTAGSKIKELPTTILVSDVLNQDFWSNLQAFPAEILSFWIFMFTGLQTRYIM